MTREEVIQMALEAGTVEINWRSGGTEDCLVGDAIIRFAALVVAAEREACAKLCDQHAEMCNGYAEQNQKANTQAWQMWSDKAKAHQESAAAIRARPTGD